jgi:hypothetical protein
MPPFVGTSFFSWAITGTNPIAPDRTNAVRTLFMTTSLCFMTLFAAFINRSYFSAAVTPPPPTVCVALDAAAPKLSLFPRNSTRTTAASKNLRTFTIRPPSVFMGFV